MTRAVDEGPRPTCVPGRVLAGRYRLERRLGVSRSAEVWRAVDERLARTVAVKLIDDHAAAMAEARAAAAVRHRGVVRVYDVVGSDDGPAWVVMEEVPGSSLAAVLAREGRLCAQEVTHVGHLSLDALMAVHDAGLVHRDIKPSNLQLTPDGRVVLIDFGLTVAPCTTGGAAVGPIAGSLPYLAPEIVEHGQYHPASDLFALGMTLFTAISGIAPVRLGYELSVPELRRLARAVAARLSEHPDLLSVILGLLDPRADKRMGADTAVTLLRRASPTFG